MKKRRVFFISLLFILETYAQNIESILKIKPEPEYELKYNPNIKYEDILKYQEKTEEKENKYDFGFNLDINRELMTIDGFKIDVGTKFKGIN
jgi:hypothetical protein